MDVGTCKCYNLRQHYKLFGLQDIDMFSPKEYCNFLVFYGKIFFKVKLQWALEYTEIATCCNAQTPLSFYPKSIDGDFVKASNKRLLYECRRCLLTLAMKELIIESFLTRVKVISTFALSLNSSNFLYVENE